MNTRICYLYRDSDNYKVHNMCVIHGELTDSQIDQILECCDMGNTLSPARWDCRSANSMNLIRKGITVGLS